MPAGLCDPFTMAAIYDIICASQTQGEKDGEKQNQVDGRKGQGREEFESREDTRADQEVAERALTR